MANCNKSPDGTWFGLDFIWHTLSWQPLNTSCASIGDCLNTGTITLASLLPEPFGSGPFIKFDAVGAPLPDSPWRHFAS